MIAMRLLFPLAFVSVVAHADVATPSPAGGVARAAASLFYEGPAEGASEQTWRFTEYAAGAEVAPAGAAAPCTVVAPLEPAVVGGRHDRFYRIDCAHQQRKIFGAELALRVVAGDQPVAVSIEADYKIHVRAPRGELLLEPAGQGYLSRRGGNVSVEPAGTVAGVPLVKLGSHPEACADFWDVYVSVVDGVPHDALALVGVADPPVMSSSTVKLDARAGSALVTTRVTDEEGGAPRIRRERYRWNGTIFAPLTSSKRAPRLSK